MSEPPTCDCDRSEVRRRTQTNGVVVATRQCLRCGRSLGCVPKNSVGNLDALPAWDDTLGKRWWASVEAFHRARREGHDAEWWALYREHLASDCWRDMRNRVYARCKGICEGCGRRPMAHAHHLTYVRLGREMLFDLVGVCVECHEAIHEREIGRRHGN